MPTASAWSTKARVAARKPTGERRQVRLLSGARKSSMPWRRGCWAHSHLRQSCRHESPLVARLQFVDQRFDLAAVSLDEGIELRAPGHDHADALNPDADDAHPLSCSAHLPLDRDWLGVGLAELAVYDRNAVPAGHRYRAVDGQALAAVLAETPRIGMRFSARGGLEESLALLGRSPVPMNAQGGAHHVVQVEIGLEHPQDPRLARRAGLGHHEIEHLGPGSLDEFGGGILFGRRRSAGNGKAGPDEANGGDTGGQTQHISTRDEH